MLHSTRERRRRQRLRTIAAKAEIPHGTGREVDIKQCAPRSTLGEGQIGPELLGIPRPGSRRQLLDDLHLNHAAIINRKVEPSGIALALDGPLRPQTLATQLADHRPHGGHRRPNRPLFRIQTLVIT